MKTLAVDPGEQRLGIAISDDCGNFARALTIIQHVSRKMNAQRIIQIAQEEGAGTVVVGVPYDSDGKLGPKARASMKLIQVLQDLEPKLIIKGWDESFSTQRVAQMRLNLGLSTKRRQAPKDAEAAAFLLQDYLDCMNAESPTNAE